MTPPGGDLVAAIARARDLFPRGLCQPVGCLALGMDGLLLAAFAGHFLARGAAGRDLSCVDLGSGTGGALLALALDLPRIRGLGLEISPQLVAAAEENARRLGLGHRVKFTCLDLAVAPAGAHAAVLANPPYGTRGCGRPSSKCLRELAMRPDGDSLDVFCRAAARMLRHHGHFFCVFPARRLAGLLGALAVNSLGVRLLQPVASFAECAAGRILVRAQKGAAADLELLPPLVLHVGARGQNRSARWTAQAREFCPRLAREEGGGCAADWPKGAGS